MLINTLERLYKGFIQSKVDSIDSYKIPVDFLTRDHDINSLVEEIECNFCQLPPKLDRSERAIRRRFFMDMRRAYTSARYAEEFTYQEFCELYVFVEKQRGILLNALQQNKEKTTSLQEKDLFLE